MRALSAIDLALWDLLGKSLDAPVYRLIGGKTNPRVRLYNTCFPYKYDFNREPEKIMRELIDTRGIRAIKIWPFDGAAQRNRNQYITQQDIDQALAPVKKLRDAFGNDIEIAMEFHSNWNLTSAIRIAQALEPYKPMWLEDMLLPGNPSQYHELALATPLPLTVERAHGGQDAVRAAPGGARRQVHHVRRDVVRRADGGAEHRQHGGRLRAPGRAAYGGGTAAVLRVHAPDHGVSERLDPGELPALL